MARVIRDLRVLMARVLDEQGRATRGSLHLRPRRIREANQRRNARRAARVARQTAKAARNA